MRSPTSCRPRARSTSTLRIRILIPAGLLAAGRLGTSSPGTTRFTAARITPHLRVTAALLREFLPVQVEIQETGEVSVSPAAA